MRDAEVQAALRTARDWAQDDDDTSRSRLAQMARVFLATHRRVAALEAERDAWRKAAMFAEVTPSQLAQARVEGARELVGRYASQYATPDMPDSFFHHLSHLRSFRDREYPATREEPSHAAPAAPEPWANCKTLLLHIDGQMRVVLFTAADAKALVALAQTTEG